MCRSKLGNSYPKEEIVAMQAEFIDELRKMNANARCADCGNRGANWATLKRAAFVCVDCAQKLRSDASNRIKSCTGTSYLWFPDEMQLTRNGPQ